MTTERAIHEAVLALDIATSVGWALRKRNSGWISHGTHALHDHQHDFGAMDHHFRGWLADMLADWSITQLVIERPFYRGGGTNVYKLNGLAWSAQSVAYAHDVPRTEIARQTACKHVLGNGNASKRDVIEWARRMDHDPDNDDEADALLHLYCWLEHVNPRAVSLAQTEAAARKSA